MGVGRNNGGNGFRQSNTEKREAKSAKRKAKSYKNSGLTTTKATIPKNIHTGLANSGAPFPIKAKKVVSVKTAVAKAAKTKVVKIAKK